MTPWEFFVYEVAPTIVIGVIGGSIGGFIVWVLR